MENIKNKIDIYTDGACINNPGEGSVGIVILYGEHKKNINGYIPNTTNNQMELLAVIIALKNLKKSCKINLYTDSKYLKNGITEWIHNWKRNNWISSNKSPIKNQKLWKELDILSQQHEIDFKWVKGHNGITYNEEADKLCQKAIKEKQPLLQEYIHLL